MKRVESLPAELDGHRLEEELGKIESGVGVVCGTVFRATREQRVMSLRLFEPGAGVDPALVGRFARTSPSRVRHPNLPVVESVGTVASETGDLVYYASRLERGDSLRDVLDDVATGTPRRASLCPLSIDPGGERHPHYDQHAVRLVAEVADGIARAHAEGLVHLRLGPRSLHFGPSGRLVVSEFDGRRPLPRSDSPDDELPYRAPEQPERGTEASDVYALGAILYEALALQPPPIAGSQPFIGLRSIRPELPADLDRIVLACLAEDPARRPSAAALAATLHAIARRPALDGADVLFVPAVEHPLTTAAPLAADERSAELEAELDNLRREIARRSSEEHVLRQRERRLAEDREAADRLRAELDARRADAEQQLEEVHAEADSSARRTAELDARETAADQESAALERERSRLEDLAVELDLARQRLDDDAVRLEDLEARLDDDAANLAEREDVLRSETARLADETRRAAAGQAAAAKEQLATETALRAAREEAARLRDKLDLSRNRGAETTSELERAQERTNALEEEAILLKDENDRFRVDMASAHQRARRGRWSTIASIALLLALIVTSIVAHRSLRERDDRITANESALARLASIDAEPGATDAVSAANDLTGPAAHHFARAEERLENLETLSHRMLAAIAALKEERYESAMDALGEAERLAPPALAVAETRQNLSTWIARDRLPEELGATAPARRVAAIEQLGRDLSSGARPSDAISLARASLRDSDARVRRAAFTLYASHADGAALLEDSRLEQEATTIEADTFLLALESLDPRGDAAAEAFVERLSYAEAAALDRAEDSVSIDEQLTVVRTPSGVRPGSFTRTWIANTASRDPAALFSVMPELIDRREILDDLFSAFRGLESHRTQAVEWTERALRRNVLSHALAAIETLGALDGDVALGRVVRSRLPEEARFAALDELAARPSPARAELLTRITIDHPEAPFRKGAIERLFRFREEYSISMDRILLRAMDDESLRPVALEWLAHADPTPTASTLFAMFERRPAETREFVLDALASSSRPEDLRILVPKAFHETRSVRELAAEILSRRPEVADVIQDLRDAPTRLQHAIARTASDVGLTRGVARATDEVTTAVTGLGRGLDALGPAITRWTSHALDSAPPSIAAARAQLDMLTGAWSRLFDEAFQWRRPEIEEPRGD